MADPWEGFTGESPGDAEAELITMPLVRQIQALTVERDALQRQLDAMTVEYLPGMVRQRLVGPWTIVSRCENCGRPGPSHLSAGYYACPGMTG